MKSKYRINRTMLLLLMSVAIISILINIALILLLMNSERLLHPTTTVDSDMSTGWISTHPIIDDMTFQNFFEQETDQKIRFRWSSDNYSSITLPKKYVGRTLEIDGFFFVCQKNNTHPHIVVNGAAIDAFPFKIRLNSTTLTFRSNDGMRPVDCYTENSTYDRRTLTFMITNETRIVG